MASKRLQMMGVIPVDEEDYGKSAYELAVDHGFEGSEEEWLASLKGADGEPGKDGAAGYVPVKGTDYYTDAEKEEMAAGVEENVLTSLANHNSITLDDYIIEQGSDDIWSWRKWASGTAELWGTITKEIRSATENYLRLPIIIWDPSTTENWPRPAITYSVGGFAGFVLVQNFQPEWFDIDTEYDEETEETTVTATMWQCPSFGIYNVAVSEDGVLVDTTLDNYTVDVRMIGRWKPVEDTGTPTEILAIKGETGYAPVKGTDYWTETDKAEMVADVIAALPVYSGEVV